MSKPIETFTSKPLGEYSDSKVTAAGLWDRYLVIGDDKGSVSTLKLEHGKNKVETQQFIGKGKIEKILVVPGLKLCYILSSGKANICKLPKLDICNPMEIKDNIVGIALNATHKLDSNRLLVITKKKKVKLFEIDKIQLKEKEIQKELSIEDIPEFYEWYDDIFCYGHKGKVHWLNLSSGTKLPSMDMDNIFGINYIQNSLVVVTNELGVFLELNSPKSITPLTLEKNFVSFIEFKNYIIAMHSESILVFAAVDQQYNLVQKITLNFGDNGKFILEYASNLVYISQNDNAKSTLTELEEISYEILNKQLIQDGKFDEALNKINDNIKSTDETKPEKIEKFFLDCGWASIYRKEFEKAYQYIHLTNYNPFEIIYMYYAHLEIKILHQDVQKYINENLSKNQIKAIIGDDNNKLKSAYKFLLDILQIKRMYILSKYELPRDNGSIVDFVSSESAKICLKNSKTKIKVIDLINCINMTLVKAMILCKAFPKEIAYIIDSSSFDWQSCDFTKEQFFENNSCDETDFAMAYFYERKGEFDKALNIWRKYGSDEKGNKNPIFSNEAKERTKKIFYKFKHDSLRRDKNIKLFQEYLKWLLEKFPDDAFEVVINTKYISPEFFLNNVVVEVEKDNSENSLREKFLNFFNEKNPDETYQTMLICEYIDKLFKMKDQNTPFNEIPFEGKLLECYNIFMNALRNKNSVYNKLSILNKIKNTWLIEGEIYLYSGLKKHNDALNKLMGFALEKESETFERVEKYCDANFEAKPDIYADFLKLLIDKQKTNKDNKKIENEILNILSKYGDVEKLDPIFALENIPANSNVCEGILYDYITKVIKQYTSLTNKYKISRNISEMALIYKEKEVLDAKNKFVAIDNETICELCRKKIGGTIFVVYPNMKIYHAKCAVNPSICPTTGVDFTKKKMI